MATTSTNSAGGFPICILTPCSNSHPFDERRILVTRSEEDAVKIGRSVVRLQPSPNNAIFDCKVLSRNHAILWMNAVGQFMIKDTRSSNGTFINNERLSISGEENDPRELFSGDILQLGVEIVDTAKKVASGCVTCIVRLLNERGEECAGRPKTDHGTFPTLMQQIPHNYTLVKNDQLFILDQYIKEATHRENQLGLKLQTLEEQLRIAQEALQAKWQEDVDQELLLSRIEQLESQLDRKVKLTAARTTGTGTSLSKNGGDGNSAADHQQRLATELIELAEDRGRIEQMAKESLRAMQEQVQELSMKLHDAEMSLINLEDENNFLRQRYTDCEAQMARQRDEFDALLVKYNSKTAPPAPSELLDAQQQKEIDNDKQMVADKQQQQQLQQPTPPETTKEAATQMPDEPSPMPKPPSSKEAATQMPDGTPSAPKTLKEVATQIPTDSDGPSLMAHEMMRTSEKAQPMAQVPDEPSAVAVGKEEEEQTATTTTMTNVADDAHLMQEFPLLYAAFAFLTLCILFGSSNIFVSNLIVEIYPIYQSVLTILSQNKKDVTHWLAYWCVFALFSLFDPIVAPFGVLFALYLFLKTTALVYLEFPNKYGAHKCYVKYVHPWVQHLAMRQVR